MFIRISRPQLLAVAGWRDTDLVNRVHDGQFALALGLTVPSQSGGYIGPDPFALLLCDELAGEDGGFNRKLAARLAREHHDKWWHGLELIEWPQLFPPPQPMIWAPTKLGMDHGITEVRPDSAIYFGLARDLDGAYQAEAGTLPSIIHAMVPLIKRVDNRLPADRADHRPPAHINLVNLSVLYERMLAAAKRAEVELGVPFTRPPGHPEHQKKNEDIAVIRAFSAMRETKRKRPGPRPQRRRKLLKA